MYNDKFATELKALECTGKSLKIAIYNCFAGRDLAETGLSRRIALAAQNIGWHALETASSSEINQYSPDFVLALHFFTPKLTQFPTFGCMWSPPAFFEREPEYVRRILSYDGFLSSSPRVTDWIEGALRSTGKRYFITPFFTSCHHVPYRPPNLREPRLLYAGTNWDGPRHRELFQLLDQQPYMDIYGGELNWRHLRHSYRGLIPLDGESILECLHSTGVGLCLHRREHIEAGTPSLRIFEIVASGAVAICEPHPFITENFGDAVLYVDPEAGPGRAVEQVSEHMRWIATHPQQALALSRRAYEIFAARFTFEKLLLALEPHHERSSTEVRSLLGSAGGPARVQVVLRVNGPELENAEHTLASLVAQSEVRPEVILVKCRDSSGLAELVNKFKKELTIELLEAGPGPPGAQLWSALELVCGDYFALLDDSDVLYPGHLASLLTLLQGDPDFGVAYGGAVRVRTSPASDPAAAMATAPEVADLAHFEPPSRDRLRVLEGLRVSHNYLARSALIKYLPKPPDGDFAEIFLLMLFSQQTDFVFSYQASMQFLEPSTPAQTKPAAVRRVGDELRRMVEQSGNHGADRRPVPRLEVIRPGLQFREPRARRIWRRVKHSIRLLRP